MPRVRHLSPIASVPKLSGADQPEPQAFRKVLDAFPAEQRATLFVRFHRSTQAFERLTERAGGSVRADRHQLACFIENRSARTTPGELQVTSFAETERRNEEEP